MHSVLRSWTILAAVALLACAATATIAAELSDAELQQQFTDRVHPFLTANCFGCHGKNRQEAELDLSVFASLADVVQGQHRWENILERLEAKEMPPAKAKHQPTDEERDAVIAWIKSVRGQIVAKHAGDPGPVLARRLSNAEYNYSIRDLTGVDIRPTREFPVDPANESGFDNSGESLAMSPALLKKYLDAARDVSHHLVLNPDGIAFAPHFVVSDTDRDKYCVARIVEFYQRQPTNLAMYFLAAWRYEHRAALGRPDAKLADFAAESKISAKYLEMVWSLLAETPNAVGPVAKLQAMWRAIPAPNGRDTDVAQSSCNQMRDFVVTLRDKLAPNFKNLELKGIAAGAQPFVLWKNRQFATHRTTYDPKVLQIEGQPLPQPEVAKVDEEEKPADDKKAYDKKPDEKKTDEKKVATDDKTGNDKVAAEKSDAEKVAEAEKNTGDKPVTDRATADKPAAEKQKEKEEAPPNPLPVNFDKNKTDAEKNAEQAASEKRAAARRARQKKTEMPKQILPDADLTVPADPAERTKFDAAFAQFCKVFPDAFFVSERGRVFLDRPKEKQEKGRLLSAGFHNSMGFFRDDIPLYEFILDDAGRRELDRLWHELDFVTEAPQRQHKDFIFFERAEPPRTIRGPEFDFIRSEDKDCTSEAKISRMADFYLANARESAESSGGNPGAIQAIEDHFRRSNAAIRWVEQARAAAEPIHLKSLVDFAARAYRRPLSQKESDDLLKFYRTLRDDDGLDHAEAMRDAIVSILMSPHFCYRVDLVEGGGAQPLSDYALASRLSYFLWASTPDDELLAHAASGDLHRPEVIAAQARRMTQDDRIRDFAVEFGGNWLDFRRFEEHNAVDRDRFSSFDNDLRQAMFEEPIRFIIDVIRNDRSVLDFLYAKDTFVNPSLAKHYGMPATKGGADNWLHVDDADQYGRGGLLPMAVFLTKNAPGLRTSPVKRGYWVVRRVLGERIPPPPAQVPELPHDESKLGELTLREVLAKHREDKSCAACHERFDSMGLVFEGYGPVGERRTKDLGDRPVDARATFPGGSEGAGLDGLRSYLRDHRQQDFVDNLCRKMLSYALGRTLIPSDDATIQAMREKLAADNNRMGGLIETIVASPQFLTKRGRDEVAQQGE